MTAWFIAWLWQALVLTAVVATVLRAPSLNAATRHLVWCVAMLVVAGLGWSAPHALPTVSVLTAPSPDALMYIESVPHAYVTAFLGIWAGVALVLLVRLIPGIHAVNLLRDRCRPFPRELERELPLWLSARTEGRRAELMLCDAVRGATVLGFRHPYIAIPSSLLSGLTRVELDQVILHEHAHVQRRDDWMRLAQSLIQAAVWVHPAVAIIGRALHREREMSCDEWVVERTGQPKAYARCLARAAEVTARVTREPLLVPALFSTRRDLLRRVDRVLATQRVTPPRASLAVAGILLTAMVAAAAQFRQISLVAEIEEVSAPLHAVETAAVVLRPQAPARVAPIVRETLETSPARNTPSEGPADPVSAAPDNPTPAASVETAPVAEAPAEHLLTARTIEGQYVTNDPPRTATVAENTPGSWHRVGAAAAQIGTSAGKTGTNLGGFFARAGSSLARRF